MHFLLLRSSVGKGDVSGRYHADRVQPEGPGVLRDWRKGRLGVYFEAAAGALHARRAAHEVDHRQAVAQQEIRTGYGREVLAKETAVYQRCVCDYCWYRSVFFSLKFSI